MKVGFFWHSLHTGNLGVGALSISNMLIVEAAARSLDLKVEYVVFGPRAGSQEVHIPELPNWRYITLSQDQLKPGKFVRLLEEIRSCDFIFDIGSGDSFSDIYGARRFLKIALSKFLVKDPERRLVLSPQTLGPFQSQLGRILGKRAMKTARYIFARDEASLSFAREIIGNDARLKLATDVAMRLPIRKAAHPEHSGSDQATIRIGLNISGLLWAGGYTGTNQFGLRSDYRKLSIDIANRLLHEPNTEVWLVPHVSLAMGLSAEDDLAACKELAKAVPGARVAGPFNDPIEAKTFISTMSFFVGARMHATIAAFSTGVPVVPLAYSRKFAGLYGSLGYDRVLDLRALADEEIVPAIVDAFRHRSTLQREVRKATEEAERRISAYEQIVHDMFAPFGSKMP